MERPAVNRGDVWWYEPPDEKPRPFLILARQRLVPLLRNLVAVPTTTRARGIPTEVGLDEDDGMPEPCVLSVDNIEAIERTYLTSRITKLGPERLDAVCAALRVAVDC